MAAPFFLRKPHFLVEIVACWETKDAHSQTNHQYHQWASQLSEALKPKVYPGGYVNLLGPAETEQINHSYGDNKTRLQKAKRTYNPDGVFNGIAIAKA